MRFGLPFLRPDDGTVLPYDRLVLDFESLGDNCEFGLVQRCAGAEPLGLFRFSSATIPNLVHALDTDFAQYGAPGDLVVHRGELDYLFCLSRRYGFSYNTGDVASKTQAHAILAREEKKVRYLKERFLADLASGDKIFVRKGRETETSEDVASLVAALRRHGPATLLRVLAAPDRSPGAVAWREKGVMEGSVRRFAPYENAPDIALEDWLDLCRRARWLARGASGEPPSPPPHSDLLALAPAGVAAHVVADGIAASRPAPRVAPNAIHTLSAWIWLPAGFRGGRVAMAFGRLRLGYREADLSKRACWQRIWIAARASKRGPETDLRILAEGAPGARFWSAGWRLEDGPMPEPGVAPPATEP